MDEMTTTCGHRTGPGGTLACSECKRAAVTSYVVRLPDGRFVGRMTLTEHLGPQTFAFASCFDDERDAHAVAAHFDGASVVPTSEARPVRVVRGAL